jgi:hypothetical protein
MRTGSGALRAADVALAARPTNASNARWFMRMFVLRRQTAAVRAEELFWTNLEIAREQFAECDQAVSALSREHGNLGAVKRLQEELGGVGYDRIGAALDEHVVDGDELAASRQLQPTVARMRICETRMLAAIQALAIGE